MLGVLVKSFLAAIGVEIINLALVFAGPARLFGLSRRHWQTARRVLGHLGFDRDLDPAASALGFLVKVTIRIFVKLLIAVIAIKIISFSLINAG